MFPEIFDDDAFSLVALTAAINNIDHVPGRAGELVFAGVGEGVATLSVAIESQNEALSLIPTSPRGGPAPKEKQDKRTLRSVAIPQIKLEDTISAHSILGVREFGTTDQLVSAQQVVNRQMQKMTLRHDLTLEHHRLGALCGKILDSDGTELVDLFSLFGIVNDNSGVPGGSSADAAPKIFDLDLAAEASEPEDLRVACQRMLRFVKRNIKAPWPSTAFLWAFCGDDFFDMLISRPDVKKVYENTAEQERRLGGNYAHGVFEFGGIVWENYRGTDDNSTVAISSSEARLFPIGVPGLYAEYFAPADFFETVNTLGLPRYARIATDNRFNQSVELHTQQNPLPLCLRPKTLIRARAQ